jgi:hypothetical protein
MTRREDSTDE